jgi:hypothetical protein
MGIVKKLLWGLLAAVLVILVSFITKSERIFIYGTQILGLGSLGLAAISSGLMSDNTYRRTSVENKEERNERLNRAGSLILFGIPSIIALLVYYSTFKK